MARILRLKQEKVPLLFLNSSTINMKSIFTSLAIALISFLVFPALAQAPLPVKKAPATFEGPNFKFCPAFIVNTYVFSYEKPFTDRFSLELAGGFKFASSPADGEATPANDAYKSGYLLDLTGRFYLGTAVEGWYLSATGGVSNIIYGNGTVRPYAYNLNSDKTSAATNPGIFRYNVGTGYQWLMLSRKLIANIGIGVGGYSNTEGAKFQILLTPSVGYTF